jgi:hypothetical protein
MDLRQGKYRVHLDMTVTYPDGSQLHNEGILDDRRFRKLDTAEKAIEKNKAIREKLRELSKRDDGTYGLEVEVVYTIQECKIVPTEVWDAI